MGKLKALSMILIALSCFSGIITSLLPSKRNLNIFRIILVCIAILSVAACFKDIKISDFSLNSQRQSESVEKSAQIEEKIDLTVESVIAEETENQISEELAKKEIFADNISVQTDRTEDGSIYIKEIKILLSEEQKYLKKAVNEFLKAYADEQTSITVG